MKRAFVNELAVVLRKNPKFIQVILGPRQVGKTTGVIQLSEDFKKYKFIFKSADQVLTSKSEWLKQMWTAARVESQKGHSVVLAIDEVQSISEKTKLYSCTLPNTKKNSRKKQIAC